MSDNNTEIAELHKEIKTLKAKVAKLETLLTIGVPSKELSFGGKTTKEDRQALRLHIEELDRQKNKPSAKPTNQLQIGQMVEYYDLLHPKTKGTIKCIACKQALPSIKKCDKTKCEHPSKTYAWVQWPDNKIFVYHWSKLKVLNEDDLKPRIGRELSGKIGPWEYNAETKLWKRDGSDKTYTSDEFNDAIYFEINEEAKEEGDEFIQAIKRGTKYAHEIDEKLEESK